MAYILPLDDSQATLETAGGKGASLSRLIRAGLPVPGGFHITTVAYRQFVAASGLQPQILAALEPADPTQPASLDAASRDIHDLFSRAAVPPDIALAITQAFNSTRALQGVAVAVRSSATAEDLPDLSFAGQQETFLNVRGAEPVLDAVKKCWASLWTARAIGYRLQHQIDQNLVALAVVVQALVPAEAAGILFTAHPVTGRRDQAMLTAAWGLGEAIVGGLVTPDTLTVDKASGRVLSRETAEKRLMTVRVDSGTEEQLVPEARRRAPVLSDRQAAELARLGAQIEQLYETPMDIEWALSEGKFAIVQARPITALPEPAPRVEWKMPNPKGRYMRGSLVDLMPDPLSPLFATLGLPATYAGMMRIMKDLTRSEPLLPADYFTTINGYAYLGFGYSGREWGWLLTRLMPSFPRMLRVGVKLWREEVRPRYAEAISHWQARPAAGLSPAELLRGVYEIMDLAGEYTSALLVGTMGASVGSEMLFTRVYDKLAKKAGDPPATAYLMGYNSLPIQAEKSIYDLAEWLRPRAALTAFILQAPLAEWGPADQPPEGVSAEEWAEWRERWEAHFRRYGHIVYNLDFARPLPMDDPAPELEACRMYLRGQGGNPHERQQGLETRREQSTQVMRQRLKGLRRWAFDKALSIGQALASVREDAIADLGLGYPQVRTMLHELGRRLVEAGALAQPTDIFWLSKADLDAAVAALQAGAPPASLGPVVQANRAADEAARRLTPPPMLPPSKKYLGIDMSAWLPADEQAGAVLKGAATSAGRVTAPARVLRGPEDFGQMRPGEVLVAAITTPAWTPLFAMASAVVTDIGGPLSHGSIVAREYNIPAVMGTGVATRRIQSGQVITVDGTAGTVSLAATE